MAVFGMTAMRAVAAIWLVILAAAWVAILAGGVFAAGAASAHPYEVQIEITNNNTSTAFIGPIPIPINALNLVDDNYVESDAVNTLFTDSGNNPVAGAGQDIGSNEVSWWWPVNIPAGTVGQVKLFAGGPSEDHSVLFGGGTDRVEIPDDATLDIATALTVSTTATFTVTPTTTAGVYYVLKLGSYGLGMRSTDELFGVVWSDTNLAAEAIPDATDSDTGFILMGCTTAHLCIDDPSSTPDDDTTRLRIVAGTATAVFDVATPPVVDADDYIETVRVQYRISGTGASCTVTVGIRLAAVDSLAPAQSCRAAYTDYTVNISRPGGGDWALADLADMQLYIRAVQSGIGPKITSAYIEVLFAQSRWISHSPGPVTSTQATTALTFDGTTLALHIDGTLVTSRALGWTLNATSEVVTIMEGAEGLASGTMIGDTSTTTPSWVLDMKFEPPHLTETQEGDAGNSWAWRSAVSDSSVASNAGVWHVTSDLSMLGILVGGLMVEPATPPAPVTLDEIDIIGAQDISVFLTSNATTTTNISALWWGFMGDLGMPVQAAGLLIVMVTAILISGLLYRAWPSMPINVALIGTIYLIGAMMGFYAWYVLAFGMMFSVLGTLGMQQWMNRQ